MVSLRRLGLDRFGRLGEWGFDGGLDLGSLRGGLGRVHGSVASLYGRRGV